MFRIQEEDRIRSSDGVRTSDGDGEDEGQEVELRSGVELSNLWLHAGSFSEGHPRQLDWEITHVREEVLGARSSAAISGKIESGIRSRDYLSSSSNGEKEELRSMHFNLDSIQVCSELYVEQFPTTLCISISPHVHSGFAVCQVHVILAVYIMSKMSLRNNGSLFERYLEVIVPCLGA